MCEDYSNVFSFLVFGLFGYLLKFYEYVLF